MYVFSIHPTPATLDTIFLYVQFLSSMLSPSAIRNYLTGVKLLHLFSGQEFPCNKDFILLLTLRGIARNALHIWLRAPLVTPHVFYHVNCGVIQGFPALRKAVTTHVKKISYFSTCVDMPNYLLTRHSPLALLVQVDEWTAKSSRFSITSCLLELSRIMAAKTLKNPYHWQIWGSEVQTFLEEEENQYTKGKTESCAFSGFGVSIFLGWEWKSTTGRFATNRFWPFTWKTSSVGKDKVNKWEFCKLKITTIVVFVIVIQRVFLS